MNTAVAQPIPIARARIASPAIDFALAHERQLRIRRLNIDQNDTSSGMSPRKESEKDVNPPFGLAPYGQSSLSRRARTSTQDPEPPNLRFQARGAYWIDEKRSHIAE